MTWRTRWLGALATGYILMFFSEMLFVNHLNLETTDHAVFMVRLLAMWLLYSLQGFIFLTILDRFRVRSVGALFLAGAAYGWLLEGIVAPTMYIYFPLQVAWTGLAWHALIDVLVGWYALRRALLDAGPRRAALIAGLIGLFWGFWAIWPWWEDNFVTPTRQFAPFAFGMTLGLIIAYAVLNRLDLAAFRPSRWEIIPVALLMGGWFILGVVPAVPFAPLVLLPLLALILVALRHNRAREDRESVLALFQGAGPRRNYALVLLMPLAASLSYGLYEVVDWRFPSNIVVLIVTSLIGWVLYIRSVVKLWRASSPGAVDLTHRPPLQWDG